MKSAIKFMSLGELEKLSTGRLLNILRYVRYVAVYLAWEEDCGHYVDPKPYKEYAERIIAALAFREHVVRKGERTTRKFLVTNIG